VAVFSPYHPLPVCSTHNVSTAAINQHTTNNHTQPSIKYVTFSITRSCRSKMLHVRSLHATGSYHIYCIHSRALPVFVKLFYSQKKQYISISCHVTGVYHTALYTSIMCQVPLSLSQRQYSYLRTSNTNEFCNKLIQNYILIYLLIAIGLSPGGSTNLNTNNTQNNTNNNRTTQITNNVEECGPCPVFACNGVTNTKCCRYNCMRH
jgi:hypothetical protein